MVRKRQVAAMLGVDWTTIDNWRRSGRFPKGITLSDQVVVWRLGDVEKWIRERENANG
jgi:predicted DNA-binding transcriptional regulator AlpA